MNPLSRKALQSSVGGIVFLGIMVFIPAGTIKYWQGWAYLVTFVVATTCITVFLAIQSPALLERRMHAGPMAERVPEQKRIMAYASFGFLAGIVIPALDHRYGWSHVPLVGSVLGDIGILLGFFLVYLVMRENQFAASTIQVEKIQKVVSTGLYAIIRHPMYAGALPILLCTPLALGSWWGILTVPVFFPALVLRLLNEEEILLKDLDGYQAYVKKVKYRLIPGIW